MSGLKRKVRRSQSTSRLDSFLDKYNEEAVQATLNDDELTHIISLHPTKGFREISKSRLNYTGPSGYMWSIISETLRKASTEPTVTKEELNGETRGNV